MSCPEDNSLRACPPAEEGKALSGLYRGALRPLLPLLSSKAVSAAGGAAMSTRASAALVPGFIRRAGIDMSDFESREWRSFNDFFTRGLRPGARPVDPDPLALVSPCDSRLLALDITPDLTFRIKGGDYSVSSLLRNRRLAEDFAGGRCLIFRLCVDDYHRYCYFDDGSKGCNIPLPGRYYTVQPVALERHDFFKENSREYTVMATRHFGKAVQVEVGATFVGRIENHHGVCSFRRGEEKGMFLFGGSTIVLLLGKNAADIDPRIIENTSRGLETRVLLGQRIGHARHEG